MSGERGGSQTSAGVGGDYGGNSGNAGQSSGGGGSQNAGGGGSSYPDNTQTLPAGITNVVHTQGANTGDSSLTISYTAPPLAYLCVNASTPANGNSLAWATAFTELQSALTNITIFDGDINTAGDNGDNSFHVVRGSCPARQRQKPFSMV